MIRLNTKETIYTRTGFSIADFFCLLCAGLCCLVGIGCLFFAVAGFRSTAELIQENGSAGAGLTITFMVASIAASVFFFSFAALLNKLAWD